VSVHATDDIDTICCHAGATVLPRNRDRWARHRLNRSDRTVMGLVKQAPDLLNHGKPPGSAAHSVPRTPVGLTRTAPCRLRAGAFMACWAGRCPPRRGSPEACMPEVRLPTAGPSPRPKDKPDDHHRNRPAKSTATAVAVQDSGVQLGTIRLPVTTKPAGTAAALGRRLDRQARPWRATPV